MDEVPWNWEDPSQNTHSALLASNYAAKGVAVYMLISLSKQEGKIEVRLLLGDQFELAGGCGPSVVPLNIVFVQLDANRISVVELEA